MNFTWKHPSKYKRIPRDKAISPEESTDSEGRTPSSNKQQASSDKQQAATIIEGDKKDE